jgi:hypothetical protein
MLRTRSIVTLALTLAFVGCEADTMVQPDMDVEASFAKGGNAPVHQVSGGGTVDVPAGRSTYAFHASMDGNGAVKGRAQIHFSSAPLKIGADVTCLVVDGNRAWLGAVITNSDAEEGSFWVEGAAFWWSAQDNGEGANADSDLVSAYRGTFQGAEVCLEKREVFEREWTNGNVQIR